MKRLVEFVSCSSLFSMKPFIFLGSKIVIINGHAVFSADWSRDYLSDIKTQENQFIRFNWWNHGIEIIENDIVVLMCHLSKYQVMIDVTLTIFSVSECRC